MTRRRTVIVVAIATAALAVAVGLVVTHRGRSDAPAAAARPPSTSAAPNTPAVPTQTPSATAVPHDVVAAAAPTSFRYAGKGYTIKATVCGMEYVRPLDPPGDQHSTVCWVQHEFGHAPGSSGKGTTYVLGHAWAQDPREVLNRLSEPATRQALQAKAHGTVTQRNGIPTYPVTALNGDVVTLRTAPGVLRYTVRDAYAVSKEQAGLVKSLMAQSTPNRVVIITCAELGHVDYDYNVIVEAYLSSSRATPTT
jgi:hypothetical protein